MEIPYIRCIAIRFAKEFLTFGANVSEYIKKKIKLMVAGMRKKKQRIERHYFQLEQIANTKYK